MRFLRQAVQPEVLPGLAHEAAQAPLQDVQPNVQTEKRSKATLGTGARAGAVSVQHLRVQEQQQVDVEGPFHQETHQQFRLLLRCLREAVQDKERHGAAREADAQQRTSYNLHCLRPCLQERTFLEGSHEVQTLQACVRVQFVQTLHDDPEEPGTASAVA